LYEPVPLGMRLYSRTPTPTSSPDNAIDDSTNDVEYGTSRESDTIMPVVKTTSRSSPAEVTIIVGMSAADAESNSHKSSPTQISLGSQVMDAETSGEGEDEVDKTVIKLIDSQQDRRRTPMIAPSPISPARELHVKNSIPQLMKALPDLPSMNRWSGHVTQQEDFEEFNDVLNPSPVQLLSSKVVLSTPKPRSGDEDSIEHNNISDDVPQSQPKTSRFKPRGQNSTSTSIGTMDSQPWNNYRNYPWTDQTPDIKLNRPGDLDSPLRTDKPRLQLRISQRPKVDFELDEDTGTVRRILGAEKSSTVSYLAQEVSCDLFTSGTTQQAAGGVGDGACQPGRTMSPPLSPPATPTTSSIPTASFSGGRHQEPVDTEAIRGASMISLPTRTTANDGETSSLGRTQSKKRHRLKTRLSNLRTKISHSYLRKDQRKRDANEQSDMWTSPETVQLVSAIRCTKSTEAMVNPTSLHAKSPRFRNTENAAHPKKLRRRISKWMKDASQAVSGYVKKRRGKVVPRNTDWT